MCCLDQLSCCSFTLIASQACCIHGRGSHFHSHPLPFSPTLWLVKFLEIRICLASAWGYRNLLCHEVIQPMLFLFLSWETKKSIIAHCYETRLGVWVNKVHLKVLRNPWVQCLEEWDSLVTRLMLRSELHYGCSRLRLGTQTKLRPNWDWVPTLLHPPCCDVAHDSMQSTSRPWGCQCDTFLSLSGQ